MINEKAILKIVKSPKFKSIANNNIGLIIYNLKIYSDHLQFFQNLPNSF